MPSKGKRVIGAKLNEYECQMIEDGIIGSESHDVKVNGIVTEKRCMMRDEE